jgi:hypothetical protein
MMRRHLATISPKNGVRVWPLECFIVKCRHGQFFKGKLCNFVSLLGGTFIPWSWLHSETGRRLEPKLIVSSFERLCLGYFVNAIEVFPSNSNGWPRCPFISDTYKYFYIYSYIHIFIYMCSYLYP